MMYFELDDDKLTLFEKKVLDSDILSVDISPIPEGRTRARFMAIGCADRSVRLLSLDIDQCLSKISMQMLPATPVSVSLIEMKTDEKELFLNVGLDNGVLMKTSVDIITGALSDTRTRYLGNRSVSLFKVHNESMLLAISSKPWLGYIYMSKYYTVPLNCDSIDYASTFTSELCTNGIVAILDNNLMIFTVERLGDIFSQSIIPLRYTPRKIAINPDNNNIVIIESDHNVISKAEKDEYKKQIANQTNDDDYIKLDESIIGVPYIGDGKWGSCIRMLDPIENKLLDLIEFEGNEAAFSSCIMTFTNSTEMYLIVGTAKDMKLNPRSCSTASIVVFQFKENGNKIEFLHRVN
jgi:splicing factor 3B subunit 3